MKFIVSSTTLLSHLQAISRVIASKSTMPILDNFLFRLSGSTLVVTASDHETTMTTSLEVLEAEGEALFAVSAKILLEPLKELPDQPLTFEVNSENLEIFIYFQNGKYNFIGVNGEEYPQKSEMEAEAQEVTIAASTLLSSINRTLFATSDEDLRPIMTGIYFDMKPDTTFFVASDSHKLVRLNNTSIQTGINASFILPKKPAQLLRNVLPKESGDVTITFDEKSARFSMENFELTCRLIEGKYPNYASVIPQNNTNRLVVDRALLINVLRRVSVFSNQASNLVKLYLTKNNMLVSAQDIDFSTSAEENITCDYNGVEMSIGFKSTFLIEILNNIVGQEIVIELSDASRAGLIFPMENQENEDLLMLLMPMMLTDF